MESKQTNTSVLLTVLALAVMACGGLLLGWTINVLSHSINTGLTFILVLTSVFLYIAGASRIGRTVTQDGEYWRFGGFHNGITFALLVVGTGCLLLCLNGGILPIAWKVFLISWPMLLFVLGCAGLSRVHYISGIILMTIGTFFLVPRFSGIFPEISFDEQFQSTWWPIFIIIGGLLIIFSILVKPRRCSQKHAHHGGDWENNHVTTQDENYDGKISYKFVFNGTEQVILDPVFKGGTIETIFGGMVLDLRRTALLEGETFLSIKTVFGGVEIKAPDDWYIEMRSESVFGGIADERFKNQEIDHTKKLIIFANAVFGGVSVRQ
jgi:predicted membrane protein